ncbi:MAG: ATP-dependent 6-phosphofructokinase [Acidobacteriota bacterium]
MEPFRILVVDDNPQVRGDYEQWLKEFGFDPLVAASIGEARHKLSTELIHLAIIDVRLNAEDENNTEGLELCREMDPFIPRIILTGYTDDWKIVRAALRVDPSLSRQRLADAFLVKEVDDPEQRLQEINRILVAEYEIVPNKRFAVLTSGGDAPGMNAALWSIVRTAMKHDIEVIGVKEGYSGLIRNLMQKLKWNSVSDIMTESGTILLSARSKKFFEKENRKVAVANIIKKNITGLIVIGGDGSMNGARALASEVAEVRGRQLGTIAIPGTIDNDLHGTDMSLGAASAANAMIDLVRQMVKPAQALRMVFVVEVMGALSGFLALQAAIGTGADAVIIPEELVVSSTHDQSWKENVDIEATRINLDHCLDRIDQNFALSFAAGKRYGFVIQAEGLDRCTRPLLKKTSQRLNAEYSEQMLKEKFNAWPATLRPEVRLQRLGYTVRGVLPSRFDVWLGATLGKAAVENLIQGATNLMVGWSERDGVVTTDFEDAVTMSNRSPSSIWADRKGWHTLWELQETLTDPLPRIT